MWIRTVLAAGFLILIGCTGRNRNNPLDPRNSETGGVVQGAEAVSEQDHVFLSWNALRSDYPVEYRIYRKQAGADDYIQIGTAHSTAFHDSGLAMGETVQYRVSAVTDAGFESPLSEAAAVTPGPHAYWVADYYGQKIVRLTYDAVHVLDEIDGYFMPVNVVVDFDSDRIWAANWRDGELLKITEGDLIQRLGGFVQPRLLAFDANQRMIWVVHDSLREIIRLDSQGHIIDKLKGFDRIVSISWAGMDSGCWVVDADMKIVNLIDPEGNWTLQQSFENPTAVDACLKDDWAWVSDDSQLLQLRKDGQLRSVHSFNEGQIVALSTDESTGGCWLAARTDGESAYHVQKVDSLGSLLCSQSGFGQIYDILADPFDGGCLVADFLWGEVVRISAEGEIISRFQAFASPAGLSIG